MSIIIYYNNTVYFSLVFKTSVGSVKGGQGLLQGFIGNGKQIGKSNSSQCIQDIVLSRNLQGKTFFFRRALAAEGKGSTAGFIINDVFRKIICVGGLPEGYHIAGKPLWCVFQPHTYTRTKAFMQDFAKALSLADQVILADIYPARETDNLGISSETLKDQITALGKTCYYFPSFEQIQKFILENCTPGDLLITMGAGDVVNIGENLLKA